MAPRARLSILELGVAAPGSTVMIAMLRRRWHDVRCPYCHAPIARHEPIRRCVACRTRHHEECFFENGRCAVFACSPRVRVRRPGASSPWATLRAVLRGAAIGAATVPIVAGWVVVLCLQLSAAGPRSPEAYAFDPAPPRWRPPFRTCESWDRVDRYPAHEVALPASEPVDRLADGTPLEDLHPDAWEPHHEPEEEGPFV